MAASPAVVEAAAARPAAHLDVLPGGDPAEAVPVPLAHIGEDDGLGGHVEPDAERLGGEEALEQALLEQDLDHLAQDGQQPRVVDADPAPQHRQDRVHLQDGTTRM